MVTVKSSDVGEDAAVCAAQKGGEDVAEGRMEGLARALDPATSSVGAVGLLRDTV